MADQKISQLTSATALAGTEVVPVVQGGVTKKATIDQILAPASGKGIDFSAAGGDTLTMYDEGTWTPVISGSSTAGAGTYSVQAGSYTRIGNRVLFSAYISWSAHTGTGNMRIGGLPFAAATGDANYGAVTVFMDAAMALTAGNMLQVRTVPGNASLFPLQAPTGGGAPSQVPLPTSGGIMITGHYYV